MELLFYISGTRCKDELFGSTVQYVLRGSNNTSSNRHGTHARTHEGARVRKHVSKNEAVYTSIYTFGCLQEIVSTYFTYSNKNSMKARLSICLTLSFPVHSVMLTLHVVQWPCEADDYSSCHPISVHNETSVANARLPTCHLSLVWSSSVTQAEAWTKGLARQAISARRQG